MSVKIAVVLDAPDGAASAYGSASAIAVQRATSTAFLTPTDLTAIPVIPGVYYYEAWDAGGSTTSWYRWRLTDGAAEQGEWSDAFQGIDPAVVARLSGAYASVDEYLLRIPGGSRPPASTLSQSYARIERALVNATDQITDELAGQTFFMSPADEVRVLDGDGSGVLHVHEGLIALTGLRIKLAAADPFVDVDEGDYRLEYWANTGSAHALPAGEAYDHVVFTGVGTYRSFPRVGAGVETTGRYGLPRVRNVVAGATIDWARQAIAMDPTGAGSAQGPSQLGIPMPGQPFRLPDSVWRLANAMSRRHIACSL